MTVSILGFSGHRDKKTNEQELNYLFEKYYDWIWVQGGAAGFDSQIIDFCKMKRIAYFTIKPNYDDYPPQIAPLERNKLIVDISTIFVVCYDGRTRGGTYQAYNYAKRRGIDIFRVTVCP